MKIIALTTLFFMSTFLLKKDMCTEIFFLQKQDATIFLRFKINESKESCYSMDTSYIIYDNKLKYLYNSNLRNFRDRYYWLCNFDEVLEKTLLKKGYSSASQHYIRDSTHIGFTNHYNEHLWDIKKINESRKVYRKSLLQYKDSVEGTSMKNVKSIYYHGGDKFLNLSDSIFVISFNINADIFLIETDCEELEEYKSQERSSLATEPVLVSSPFVIVGKCNFVYELNSRQTEKYNLVSSNDSLRMCFSPDWSW